jgi:hypothetical protein
VDEEEVTTTSTDLSSAVYEYLLTRTSYTDLLVGGLHEAGFVNPDILDAAQVSRRRDSSAAILAASVQDDGDRAVPVGNRSAQVVIWHWDRGYGYRHLRTARDMLCEVIRDAEPILIAVAGRKRGVLTVEYQSRTGHRKNLTNGCDYEAIALGGYIIIEE